MAERGYVDVSWIGGPYDGSSLPLSEMYLGARYVDMPDPATAASDGADEPAVFTGPSHRYALSAEPPGLVARHLAG